MTVVTVLTVMTVAAVATVATVATEATVVTVETVVTVVTKQLCTPKNLTLPKFLAALSSSRSPVVCPSVRRSVYVCEKATFRVF